LRQFSQAACELVEGSMSDPVSYQACQVRLNPPGIGADITLAHARYRADIDSTTYRRGNESHDRVILKTNPGGGVGGLNPQRI